MASRRADEDPRVTEGEGLGASTEPSILRHFLGQTNDGVERHRAATRMASGEGRGADLGSEPAGISVSIHSQGAKPWTRCW